MGEPQDMSVRLLKEVLDDLNVTYKASEKKRDLIAKVRQARERFARKSLSTRRTLSFCSVS